MSNMNTTKSDVGFTFSYGERNGKPHALTSISGKPDRIPHSAQTITYTDFKKVKSISLGNKSLVLDYGVDEQRRKGVFKEENVTFTRYYSGNYEEEISSSGKIKKIHYISGGDGLAGIYINDDGNSNFYSAYCDYQGSLLALTDINGVVKEKYAYDPWGNRRNPALWKDADTRTKFIIDRGYTLHEHLDALGLINMNGRVYDPLLGMFLSPDPYVQAPGNWLNYNRYGYCYGNPLSYTDPNGEFFFAAIFIGAIMNAAIQGFTGNLHGGVGDFFKAAGVGALSGAAGAGASQLVSGMFGAATTLGGAMMQGSIIGGAGGSVGGWITGMGNARINGGTWGQSLKSGLIGSGFGAASGILLGGITGGIQYRKQILTYQRGCEELGITENSELPKTDDFLLKAQKEWYKDAPMENIKKFTVENVPEKSQQAMMRNNAPAATVAFRTKSGLFTGESNVYFNKHLAFSSSKQLFFSMGHEFVHVSQYSVLAGLSHKLTVDFVDMLEFHAYSFQNSLGGKSFNAFDNIRSVASKYGDLFKRLSYVNFSWTSNVTYKYPF